MEQIDVSELYQAIKHRGRSIQTNEMELLESVIISPDNYDPGYITGSILCLALGSSYFEVNPSALKAILRIELRDSYKVDLFRAIQYTKISRYYRDEIFEYAKVEAYLNDYEESSKSAVLALAQIAFSEHDEEAYNWLYNTYTSTLSVFKNSKDEQFRNLIFDYLKNVYYSLLYCLNGDKSKQIPLDRATVIENKLQIPVTLM